MHCTLEDPAAFEGFDNEKLAKFREIRDKVEQHIQSWLEEQETSVQNM